MPVTLTSRMAVAVLPAASLTEYVTMYVSGTCMSGAPVMTTWSDTSTPLSVAVYPGSLHSLKPSSGESPFGPCTVMLVPWRVSVGGVVSAVENVRVATTSGLVPRIWATSWYCVEIWIWDRPVLYSASCPSL